MGSTSSSWVATLVKYRVLVPRCRSTMLRAIAFGLEESVQVIAKRRMPDTWEKINEPARGTN
jgi:hypothetical protein